MTDLPMPTSTSPCGRRHTIPLYALGCMYASELRSATPCVPKDPDDGGRAHLSDADALLVRLATIEDVDDLRDFIAGVHHFYEDLAARQSR
jgi:hypothetical protein